MVFLDPLVSLFILDLILKSDESDEQSVKGKKE